MLRRTSWTRPDWIKLNPTPPAIRSAVSATSPVAVSAFASTDSQAIVVSDNKVELPASLTGTQVYLAFAIPETDGEINSISAGGGFMQLDSFEKQAGTLMLGGVEHEAWVSKDALITSAIEDTTWIIGISMEGFGQASFKSYARITGADDDGLLEFLLDAAIQEQERIHGISIGASTFIYDYSDDDSAPDEPPFYPPLKAGTTPMTDTDEMTYTYETQGVEDPVIRQQAFNTALHMYEQRGEYKSPVRLGGYGI